MKILLINPIIRVSMPPSYFPLGLAYIAAVVQKEGHDVEVMDINGYRYTPDEVENKIKKADFDYVGITGFITEYNQIKWLSDKLKQYNPTKPIILGGGLASAVTEYVLESTLIDIVVIGEGEKTITSLLECLIAKEDLSVVDGIAFKKNQQIVKTRDRQFINDLDELPMPFYEMFPVETYARGEKLGFAYPVRAINIISSRGCPYKCNYCYHGISGYKYRKRSADNIINEIIYLKKNYNLDGIVFSDDTFIIDRGRVVEFCEKLNNLSINLKWSCNGRVDLVDEKLLKKMKTAGCVNVSYGIESGSSIILKNMKKGFTKEKAEESILMTQKVGLRTSLYFIIGMIGETEKTIIETKEFCKKIKNKTQFSIATPFPGTELFEIAKSKNLLPQIDFMLKKWDIWNYNILVNLSQLSDKELLLAKNNAEEEINSMVTDKKNEIFRFFLEFGMLLTIIRLFSFIKRRIYPESDTLNKTQDSLKRQQYAWSNILTGEACE